MTIITNNKLVLDNINMLDVDYLDTDYEQVLLKVKDTIINDHAVLLSHPLSGSIKPNETYYKSVLVKLNDSSMIDMESLELIETAVEVYNKFIKNKVRPDWSESTMSDFEKVDYYLIKGALESANVL